MRKNGKKKIDMVQDAKLALVKKNKKCCKTCFREKKKKKTVKGVVWTKTGGRDCGATDVQRGTWEKTRWAAGALVGTVRREGSGSEY